jgi:hypothetical protein
MQRLALAALAILAVSAILSACQLLPATTEPPVLPAGTHECFGLDEQLCLNLVAARQKDQSGRTVAAFRVRCLGTCVLFEGAAEITIVWSDGTDDLFRTEWRGAPQTAPPEPPATLSHLS